MSNYYKEKQKAFRKLDEFLEKASKEKMNLNLLKVKFILTDMYQIGESTIYKRLVDLEKLRGDFTLNEDEIIFKKEAEK